VSVNGRVQRARSDEAKATRLLTILRATSDLFHEVGQAITLSQVAERAHLSRTTLYGYASTKEELLLLLTASELHQFFEGVAFSIARGMSPADAVASTVTAQPQLASLLAHTATVFEANVSLDAAIAWKIQVNAGLTQTGALIDSQCTVAPGTGARFLLHAYAAVTGLHTVAEPAPIAAAAIDSAHLDALRIDFHHELVTALHALQSVLLPSPPALSPEARPTRKTRP
jgi:AcrR family transcriptional regulator